MKRKPGFETYADGVYQGYTPHRDEAEEHADNLARERKGFGVDAPLKYKRVVVKSATNRRKVIYRVPIGG